MKKIIQLIIVLLPVLTFSQIINIPDDYPTIQEGIDAAINGDTVLVDTGIYYENINFGGKAITVASTYIFNENIETIQNTTIDGQMKNPLSIVTFENQEGTDSRLIGFTLTNSYAVGGGIYIGNASPYLKDLIIKDNIGATYGGGIACINSNAIISNVDIYNNSVEYGPLQLKHGGGIYCGGGSPSLSNVRIHNNNANWGGGLYLDNSFPIFDTIDRCSIYNNSAFHCQDIYSIDELNIVLDTFTVLYPTDYYASHIRYLTFDINSGIKELINNDLYVSPEGDNENTGLTFNDPLKNIDVAFSRIMADADHYNTVHLLNGTYSPSTNGESFIEIIDYVKLSGNTADSVIIDRQGQGGSVIRIRHNLLNSINNITITGADGGRFGGIQCEYSNPTLNSVKISGNIARKQVVGSILGNGGGISCYYSHPEIRNVLIGDNYAEKLGGGIFLDEYSSVEIYNTTIVNNEAGSSGGGINSLGSNPELINSIIWNNIPDAINGNATVTYSDIQEGWAGIGNINQDPIFINTSDHPYQLNENSPCIDNGIPDTTGLNLPNIDILGNQRIWDGDNDGIANIDMGVYEFGSIPVGINNPENFIVSENNKLKSYPNPFTTSTNIEYTLSQPQTITITFYNQFGKLVDVIEKSQQKGLNKVVWTPEHLADGIYYLKLSAGEKSATGKLVLMR